MAQHPLNLTVRFILELGILLALGIWGWTWDTGNWRFLLAIGLPLIAAVLWGTFRVPNDPGRAPIAIPGWLRLMLELALFGLATWGLISAGATLAGWIFGGVTLVHYLISYDRILWLLKQ